MCGSSRKSKKKQKGGKKAAAAASRGNFAPRPAHSQRLTPTRMSPKSRIQKKEIVLPLERTPRGRAFALASFFHSFPFLLFFVLLAFSFPQQTVLRAYRSYTGAAAPSCFCALCVFPWKRSVVNGRVPKRWEYTADAPFDTERQLHPLKVSKGQKTLSGPRDLKAFA